MIDRIEQIFEHYSNNINILMDQIESIPGKLLYTVYQMHKQKMIDSKGKLILKDLIISNNSQIKAAYQQYQRNGTQLTLRGDLFRVVNNEREEQKRQGLSQKSKKSSKPNKPTPIPIPTRSIQKVSSYIRET